MKDHFILACQDYFVKPRESAEVRKQHRVQRDTVTEESISPRVKALGRHIARCQRKRKPVRIPALNVVEWGQLLRSLEIKRAYA